ncbi:hypothetical protein BGW38_000507 [Lunasporangiospora selenospora]|uniref:CRAL-TRIO domain-containing protein n=1 Tax=Lunasporangiospora selenospora TaxID=979761 RepID=A0A9P6FVE7_9FUNG|nr:hypothetical protein BGW38_000507 [Lunasporangiospora selenospora]
MHPRRSSSYGISSGHTHSNDPATNTNTLHNSHSATFVNHNGTGNGINHGLGLQQPHSQTSHHHQYHSESSASPPNKSITPPPASASPTLNGHGPRRSSHGGSNSPAPASPTRLDQSFYQPSIASATPPGIASPNAGTGLISSLPGGAAAAAAALRRSAAKLKPWLPAKKFTFKYSPAEYQTAFWAFVQNEHPDTTVLRFLRARKWNVEKAMEMLILALEWRITMGVDEVLQESEETLDAKYPGFLDQLKSGKVIFRGQDRHGRPLCLLDPSQHNPGAQSSIAVQKLSIYVIETARMTLKPPTETISTIFDMSNFSMANMDWPTVKFFIHAAEACYPELLGICVLHKAPWIFGALWKVISPMLDPVIRAKVQFTNSRKDLEEFISPDQLMKNKSYEGDDDQPYTYVAPQAGENQLLTEDSEAKQRAITKRRELELTFERLTEIWQGQKQLSSSAAVIQERNEVGNKMAEVWWGAEPYTRARTVYHRTGSILRPSFPSTGVGTKSLRSQSSSPALPV